MNTNQVNALSATLYDTKSAAFETNNGESILVYYNPLCRVDDFDYKEIITQDSQEGNTIQYLCANFVYDLNGLKGPNKFGKDIGAISVFYSVDSNVITVTPYKEDLNKTNFSDARTACRKLKDDYKLPTLEELMALYINKKMYALNNNNSRYWSISQAGENKYWSLYTYNGTRRIVIGDGNFSVRCVKR